VGKCDGSLQISPGNVLCFLGCGFDSRVTFAQHVKLAAAAKPPKIGSKATARCALTIAKH